MGSDYICLVLSNFAEFLLETLLYQVSLLPVSLLSLLCSVFYENFASWLADQIAPSFYSQYSLIVAQYPSMCQVPIICTVYVSTEMYSFGSLPLQTSIFLSGPLPKFTDPWLVYHQFNSFLPSLLSQSQSLPFQSSEKY